MTAVLDLPKHPASRPAFAEKIKPLPARMKLPVPRTVRVGFVRLVDAAPLVAAAELGFFERRKLNVVLSREIGWATLRHRATFDDEHGGTKK